jgi:hypothetical protein
MKKQHQILMITTAIVFANLVIFMTPKITLGANLVCTNLSSNLKFGSKDRVSNSDVSRLQNFLNSQGYMKIAATGYFGNLTREAVVNFQKKESLPATGLVMTLTRGKISDISCREITNNVKNTEVVANVITPSIKETPAVVPIVSNQIKLPYNSLNFSDWVGVWGKVSTTTDNTLEIKASTETNGAQAMLPNSNEWVNYRQNVNVLVKQASIILISRYVDENNFLGCTFSGKYIEIFERIDGQSRVVESVTLESAPYTLFFYNDLNISMSVKDKTVGCGIIGGDDNVIYTNINSKLLKGGIGVQTWLNAPGIANVELKNVKVTEI